MMRPETKAGASAMLCLPDVPYDVHIDDSVQWYVAGTANIMTKMQKVCLPQTRVGTLRHCHFEAGTFILRYHQCSSA